MRFSLDGRGYRTRLDDTQKRFLDGVIYRHGNAPRLMSLDPHEFIRRRFLIHSLPDGFHRIRHYGFLANGCRRARLAIIRQRLVATEPTPTAAAGETTRPLPRFDPTVCPCCGGIRPFQ